MCLKLTVTLLLLLYANSEAALQKCSSSDDCSHLANNRCTKDYTNLQGYCYGADCTTDRDCPTEYFCRGAYCWPLRPCTKNSDCPHYHPKCRNGHCEVGICYNDAGARCKFPFKYGDFWYAECTRAGGYEPLSLIHI